MIARLRRREPARKIACMRRVILALLALALAAPAVADDAAVYRARCAACHGEDGRGDSLEARALKVPPLQGYDKLRGLRPGEIVAAIRANPKHAGVADVMELDDAELRAAARHVTRLVHREP